MIYRYDQPVDMPIPELYDTGLMQAYTQAIREQFEKGEKRLDEFASKYGNFTSPFAKDIQDWDRLTMGRINNIYNDLVSKGIDPLRSREGQSIMAQAIRQTPVGELNQLRQSATIGQQYLKAVQDAQRRGEYNPDFEKYLLKNLGIDGFNDYSTLSDGPWNRTAPGIYQTLGKATNDWYDELKPTNKGKKNGYMWTGIDVDDLINVAKPRAQGFANTELGRFYKDSIKDQLRKKYPNATVQELEDATNKQFITDIANSHPEKLIMIPTADQYDLLAAQEKYKEASEYRKFKRDLTLKDADGKPTTVYPASESTVRNTTITDTQDNNIVNWSRTLVRAKQNYYQNIMDRSKKGSKEYTNAAKYLQYWNTVEKHPYKPGNGLQPLLVVENGVTKPSKFLRRQASSDLRNSVLKGGSDATSVYINNRTSEFGGQPATRIKNSISNNWEKVPGSEYKFRTVDYGTGKYTYSAVKVKGMYGGRGSKLQRMFNNWLKHNNIRTYMTGETIRADRAKGSNTTGVNTYYFNTYITEEDLVKFIQYYNKDSKERERKPLDQNSILKHLGIVSDDFKQYKGDDKRTHTKNLYKFSSSYTRQDSSADAFDDIEYDKSRYGTTKAYELAPNRQGESKSRADNLE